MKLTAKTAAKLSIPYLQRRVLGYFLSPLNRLKGRTCEECEVDLGMRHQTASARIRELVVAGLLEDTKARRQNVTGRTARVYKPVAEYSEVQVAKKDGRSGENAGQALVGVECYVWDGLSGDEKVHGPVIVREYRIDTPEDEHLYSTGIGYGLPGVWWKNARPAYLGKPEV